MDYFIKLIKRKYKVDIKTDNRALQKLRREAERAKRALSSAHQVSPLLSRTLPAKAIMSDVYGCNFVADPSPAKESLSIL